MKEKRQAMILELIQKYDIETQEELTKHLIAAGFPTTQGTISRDIRELKLTKVAGSNGRQKYAAIRSDDLQVSNKFKRVLKEAIIHIESARNILVIKTVSGMAMACAAAIDNLEIKGVVGCIAGDDTIFCAIKEESMVYDVIQELQSTVRGRS
ncbi:MAG: arginine repressor [Lachnospiraceae bacterium]|nr:arginine repressor [Lachnospiraceae bacterium]